MPRARMSRVRKRLLPRLPRNAATWWWWGEGGHPEVEGLVAYAHEAGAQVHVAETAADLPGDLPEHVGVVVQTTQTREALDDVLEGIRAQGVAAQVKDTVCTATRQRQQAAAELAGQVDAIVVIGGAIRPIPRIWPRSALRNARARTTSSRPPSLIPRGSWAAPPSASRQAPAPPTTRSTKWCSVWSACSDPYHAGGPTLAFPVRRHGAAFPIYPP